jgi:ABC-type transport system involved in multi-copper enzyme maturation permease subunit
MTQIEQQYRRWEGSHEGIWRRRLVIAGGMLQGCLKGKWLQRLVASCWIAALGQIILLFFYSQLMSEGSAVYELFAGDGEEDEGFTLVLSALSIFSKQNPELAISVPWKIVFGFYSLMLFWPTMLVLTVAVPRIISADLSSNAIVLYASKAVSRWDYLLGKLGAVAGLIMLTWVGPILFAWLGGNLLAPSWKFFWLTREALFSSITFGLVGLGFLAVLTLGISALSPNGKVVTFAWLALWLLGWGMEAPAEATRTEWMRHLSFRYNLSQVHTRVFSPGDTFDKLSTFRNREGEVSPLVRPMRVFTRMQNRELRWADRRARRRVYEEMNEQNPEYEQETERLVNLETDEERQEEIRMEREDARDEFRRELRGKIRKEEEAAVIVRQARHFQGALVWLGLLMALSCGVIYLRLRPQ